METFKRNQKKEERTITLKKRGNAFFVWKSLMLGVQTQLELLKSSLRQKEGYVKYYFYIYILTDTKLYYLILWTSKDQVFLDFHSRSQPVV
jgi:hypothetical protein